MSRTVSARIDPGESDIVVCGRIAGVKLLRTVRGHSLWIGRLESRIHEFPIEVLAYGEGMVRRMPGHGVRCIVTGLFQGTSTSSFDRGCVVTVAARSVRRLPAGAYGRMRR